MNDIYNQFKERCIRAPENIAIITEGKQYSYRDFLTDVESMADILASDYIDGSRKCVIALYMDRGYELIVALWAIIRIHGTYVPVDTAFNHERIRYVLEDSKASRIITDDSNRNTIAGMIENAKILVFNGRRERAREPANPAVFPINGDFSYILYTSGSTGRPKGIYVNGAAFESFLENFDSVLPENGFSRIIAHTSVSFDISLVELVYPFILGNTVIICNDMQSRNIKSIMRLVSTHQADCLQTTPSLLSLLLMEKEAGEKLKSVKYLLVGGEVFPRTLLEKAKQTLNCSIYNLYGPTEATVWCMAAELTNFDRPVIGKPFGANTVFLMDDNSCVIVEPDMAGELCIAGSQLAEGYLNKRSLTDTVFIDNPEIYHQRFYKTGDLACYENSGNIVYHARLDNQIKLNGRRIELEEIEENIKKLCFIKDVVVNVVDVTYNKYLRCFYVAEKEHDSSEIKQLLKEHLPGYMIPKEYYRIEKIPLTNNGKKDRNALANFCIGAESQSVQTTCPLHE